MNLEEQWINFLSDAHPTFGIPNPSQITSTNNQKNDLENSENNKMKYLALLPYQLEDEKYENGNYLQLSPKNQHSVLLNLFEKLGIQKEIFFYFIHNSNQNPYLSQTKSIENLNTFIQKNLPKSIFCFGLLSFHALCFFSPELFYQYSKNEKLVWKNQIPIHVLPTPEELYCHTHWRASVWSELLPYKISPFS